MIKTNEMKVVLKYFLFLILTCSCSCSDKSFNKGENPKPGPQDEEPMEKHALAYVTTADKTRLFDEEILKLGKKATMSPNVIKFSGEKFQEVDGFGAAVTVSSCYLLQKMEKSARKAFLEKVFDRKKGAGSNMVRVCIGGSDFTWDYGESGLSSDGRYTWCDKKGMENFAPHPMDVRYVVPIMKEILEINPDLKIIASPWTAPRWMKLDSKLKKLHYSWTGGRLNPEYYGDYAAYFVKWIEYMKSQGINIYAVTPQNEALHAGNSMSMLMFWEDCRDFIKNGLGPAFEKAGIKTKILIFDHNFNYDNNSGQYEYPLKVYADPEASKYIAGSAWHNYGGNATELDKIAEKAPDKEIYFTEASIGTWNYKFSDCLINDFRDIIMATLGRGARGVTFWNLVLDDKKGPYTNASGSCTTCYGAVTIMSSDHSTLDFYSQYYNFAHCSKVIHTGAVRLGLSGYEAPGLSCQAYKNPDSSYGVIILNENSEKQALVFLSEEHSVRYEVPARSIVSLSWKD